MTEHTCHIPYCQVEVPPKMLMCRTHWYKVSKQTRNLVWEHYQTGQERRLVAPTKAWMKAADMAIEEVIQKEVQS